MFATIYDLDDNNSRTQKWERVYEVSDASDERDVARFCNEIGRELEAASGSYAPGEHSVEVVFCDDEGETVLVETVTRTVA